VSDLGTMRLRTQEELPRRGTPEVSRVTLAIISAIVRWRSHNFGFNEFTDQFTVTVGQESYDNTEYDSDLLGIGIVTHDDTNDNWSDPLGQWPFTINRLRTSNTTSDKGYPDYYYWFAEKLWVSPVPHLAYDLRIDGIKDVGTPVVTGTTGGVFTFYEPDGSTALSDSYTSDWFTGDMEELIRTSAKIDLMENWLEDDRGAARLRRREADIYRNVRHARHNFRRATKLVPYA